MMTNKEIQILNQACKMAGTDPRKVKPENPFSKQGSTAGLIQAAVAEIDPGQAAKWRVEAGASPSVATLAELNSGGGLSPQAVEDLFLHDPEFVPVYLKKQTDSDAALLAKLEADSEALRLGRETRMAGGNEHVAKERIQAQDAKAQADYENRLASAKHAQEMQQRINKRRVQEANFAGRFAL